MRRNLAIPALILALALPALARSAEDELSAARDLFEKNLSAIKAKDKDAYLATYLQSPTLARTGPSGFSLGYDDLAAGAGSGWPDTFEGLDLRLVPVRPGVVYGTYRYRVRYGADESSGISERLFIRTDSGEWKIAVTTAFENPPGTPPPPRAIVGGTLIDGTGRPPVPDSVVVIRNGEIDCAGNRDECQVPDNVEVLDASGKWITPGLIDTHVHFSQTGWCDARPDALDVRDAHPYEQVQARLRAHPETFFRSYLCSGITGVFDVGGMPWTTALPQMADEDGRAPAVRAAGPLLSTVAHEILNLPAEKELIHIKDEASARAAVRYVAAIGSDAVKVWFIEVTPELEAAVMAAGDEAKRAGLPLIVHATTLATAKVAVRAGARLLVHSVEDVDVDEEFLRTAKAAGTFYCPTLTVRGGYLRLMESAVNSTPPPIDDPNGCVDRATLERIRSTAKIDTPESYGQRLPSYQARVTASYAQSLKNLAKVHDAGIPVVMGTDAGNPLTLHGPSVYAELEAMAASGLTPMDVLMSSTATAAAALPQGEKLGAIRKGNAANLLLMTADPLSDIRNMRQLEIVIRGGVARTVHELSDSIRLGE